MRKILKVLIATSVLFTMAGGMLGPIYAIFVKEIGGDILSAGEAYAVFALAAGLITLVISKWEDHIKHIEKLVVFGYLLSTIGFFAHLYVKTPYHLFLVQMLFGFSAAILNPAYDALYSKYLQKGKIASQWGLWEAENMIVTAIASVIGAYVAKVYGFKTLLVLMFVFSDIGLIASLGLLSRKLVAKIFSLKKYI